MSSLSQFGLNKVGEQVKFDPGSYSSEKPEKRIMTESAKKRNNMSGKGRAIYLTVSQLDPLNMLD